ncbi:MAG: MFS transporter [Planctomycetota bacterium]|nr:MFS transporter [Planctomycetota bacterium]
MSRAFTRWLERVGQVQEGEGRLVFASALTFFFLLFGYFLLRPMRDMYGVRGGLEQLPYLTVVVVLVMLAVNPIFGAVVSRVARSRFVPAFYRFVIACTLVFFVITIAAPFGRSQWVGRVFFVWLSVFNLFMTSVFWQVMADLWRPEQAKRLYGLVGVGGTLGAFLGSLGTTQLIRIGDALDVGRDDLTPWLFLVAAVFFELAVRASGKIRRTALPEEAFGKDEGLGGDGWQGLRDVVSSPYLRGICGYLFLFTLISTLIYYVQGAIISATAKDDATRLTLFAWRNVGDQGLTLLIQLFFTGRIMQAIGVGKTLAILPAVTALGLAGVAVWPVFVMIWFVQVARRGSNFGLSKPARESLFAVLPRDEKYKAKAVADTFVYRAGDVTGAAICMTLPAGMGAILPAVAVGVPLTVAWGGVSIWLGRRRHALAAAVDEDQGKPSES